MLRIGILYKPDGNAGFKTTENSIKTVLKQINTFNQKNPLLMVLIKNFDDNSYHFYRNGTKFYRLEQKISEETIYHMLDISSNFMKDFNSSDNITKTFYFDQFDNFAIDITDVKLIDDSKGKDFVNMKLTPDMYDYFQQQLIDGEILYFHDIKYGGYYEVKINRQKFLATKYRFRPSYYNGSKYDISSTHSFDHISEIFDDYDKNNYVVIDGPLNNIDISFEQLVDEGSNITTYELNIDNGFKKYVFDVQMIYMGYYRNEEREYQVKIFENKKLIAYKSIFVHELQDEILPDIFKILKIQGYDFEKRPKL